MAIYPQDGPTRASSLADAALRMPVAHLGLCTRALRRVAPYGDVGGLLQAREDALMGSRGFGRACLVDVRRRLARYVVDAAAVPEGDPVRALLVSREPEILAVWEAPPQTRTLESVVDEILALLARGEQLRAAGGGRRPLRNGGLPVAIDFGHAPLPEVAAFVLAGLRPREREVLELRFSGTDGEGPSLSTLGKRFGLTRERVRQIGAAALARLGRDTEVQRRKPLTDHLLERFRAGGGILREMAVVTCLRDRYPGPRGLAYTLSRVLLAATPSFERVAGPIWCGAPLTRAEAICVLETTHECVRSGGRLMSARQLTAAVRLHCRQPDLPEALVAACVAADGRFQTFDGGRVGLREWAWGIPASLEEHLAACLRSCGRPQSTVRLTEHVNSILPAVGEASRETVSAALAGGKPFVRVRSGVYGLAEWSRGL